MPTAGNELFATFHPYRGIGCYELCSARSVLVAHLDFVRQNGSQRLAFVGEETAFHQCFVEPLLFHEAKGSTRGDRRTSLALRRQYDHEQLGRVILSALTGAQRCFIPCVAMLLAVRADKSAPTGERNVAASLALPCFLLCGRTSPPLRRKGGVALSLALSHFLLCGRTSPPLRG